MSVPLKMKMSPKINFSQGDKLSPSDQILGQTLSQPNSMKSLKWHQSASVKCLKYCAYTKGLLSITQWRGLITLIPKKNKPTNLLKNWRPITLLNCDYKIATKSIANRIRKVLPKIINNDQTGFLKADSLEKTSDLLIVL